MTTLHLRASGPASAVTAWERYARPERWADWAPQILRVETAAERIAPGIRGRVIGPLGVSVSFVIDGVDEAGRTWAWTVRRFPITLRLRHSVARRGTGCTTALTVRGPLPVVLAYAPVARIALGRLVRR